MQRQRSAEEHETVDETEAVEQRPREEAGKQAGGRIGRGGPDHKKSGGLLRI